MVEAAIWCTLDLFCEERREERWCVREVLVCLFLAVVGLLEAPTRRQFFYLSLCVGMRVTINEVKVSCRHLYHTKDKRVMESHDDTTTRT